MKPSRVLSTWLAVLLLTGSGMASGQEVPQEEPAQAPTPELTPPPLIPVPAPGTSDTPSRTPPPDEEAPRTPPPAPEGARPSVAAARPEDPVPRVAVELVGGTAGGVVVGTLGLVAGYLLSAPTVGCDECRVVSLVGGFTGVLVGIPTGTWLGGRLMGGRGQFLATAGGSLVGWGGALLGSLLMGASAEDDALALALLVLPVAGAATGYELSQPEAPAPRASQSLRVIPLAAMTERGPRLGLMGRF
ncbi:GlsB/YeaQ/YmgE family stress response membrane protein [Pyxidicoccus xibeiensis]|uniref:GlsB/YeaQ/YmgE family stress response membrane protein n=1 Tax=Pyxidicoccus xibeiensis TaxID=2906759 RepID=UPI0020A78F18|nr:GlsB/YeaQ/YmgE family stress response membrane protein [Pyxidicoccus xibeiensis]MCP3144332.1 GlsB/YeaQ/YmgE family stress response membrane protein [Pyxidicoccus xibeiensis]